MNTSKRFKGLETFAAALVFAATLVTGSAQAQTIKIGAPLALTGGLADEGKKQQIAYDMWLKRVNAQGGISVGGKKMRVEIIQYDYQTNEQRVQQLAEKLIVDDKVDFLLAPFGSGHTKVVAGVAERYGVPVLATSASSESIFDQGYKYMFGTLAANGGSIDNLLAVVTKQMPNVKKIAILGREDVFPKSMATTMEASAKKLGLQVLSTEYYPVGALDLATPIAKIKSLNPDWIYVTGYSKDLVLARKQMADLNVKAPVVTMITGPVYKEYIDSLGPLAEGVTSASWWHHSVQYNKSDDPWGSTKAFYDEFVAREKSDPDYVHAAAAAALVALQKAIEKAGTLDKAKVRDALASLDIVTFYGPIKFNPNGMNGGRSLPIIQVQGGKPIILFPENIKQGTLQAVK